MYWTWMFFAFETIIAYIQNVLLWGLQSDTEALLSLSLPIK